MFSVPAGVRAVLVMLACRDSGSAANDTYVILSPNDTADQGPVQCRTAGIANDQWHSASGIVPCDSGGDIYYQVAASAASATDIILQVWGYWL